MAPYKPALGPRPELTPNASARGSATIYSFYSRYYF